MIAVGSGFPDILKKHDIEIKKNASISLKFITGWKVEKGEIHLGIWRAGNTLKYDRPKMEKNEKGLSFCKYTNILSCAILKQKKNRLNPLHCRQKSQKQPVR